MSPEPSELIVAFVSKVPFFRGLGPGVPASDRSNSLNRYYRKSIVTQIHRLDQNSLNKYYRKSIAFITLRSTGYVPTEVG